MKLTAVNLAIAMVLSVLCSYLTSAETVLAFSPALIIITLLTSFIHKRVNFPIIILSIGFIAGIFSYMYATSSHTHPLRDFNERYVSAEGIIISTPQEINSSDNYRYIVKASSFIIGNNTINKKDFLLLSTPQLLSPGDKISFAGIVKAIPSIQNENGFNSALYYMSQNIYSKLYSENISESGKGLIISPYFFSQKLYYNIDRIIYKYYSGDTAAIISAILTGNMHHFSEGMHSAMTRTGFTRLLHPAFLHLLIIYTLIGMLSSFTQKKKRTILSLIVIGLYALFSSSNIGFTRCLLTAALMIFYKKKDGSANYIDILSKMIIVCTIAMPLVLLNTGFVLSIVSGLLIRIFSPHIYKRLHMLPRIIRRMSTVMVICALFVTPLSSVFFSGVCIYSFILPFIITPLVLGMLILTIPVFIMLSLFGTAPIIGGYFDFILWLIKKLPYVVDNLPLSRIITAIPSPSEYLLIIMLIVLCGSYLYKNKSFITFSKCAVLGLSSAVAVNLVSGLGTTVFTFVNVGQGDGSVIHTGGGATVLIDGGGGGGISDYNPGEYQFVPYLQSKGYQNIDIAFVSHFHTDHVEGIISAIKNLNVKNVFYLPPSNNDEEALEEYHLLTSVAKEKKTQLHPIEENTRISFDNGPNFEVYVPEKSTSNDANEESLLIKADYAGKSILYTGDMTKSEEYSFLKKNIDIDADILKVAHHGSQTSTSSEWIQSVSPDFAVISCGENNSYGHPSKKTLLTLKNIKVLRSDLSGDIKVSIKKSGKMKINSFK